MESIQDSRKISKFQEAFPLRRKKFSRL